MKSIMVIILVWQSFVSLDLRTLGILNHSQPNGLAVPDATMRPVESTSDVMELMDMGLRNRTVGATALNERSSRSHRFIYFIFYISLSLYCYFSTVP
jgi:hypothetical protein